MFSEHVVISVEGSLWGLERDRRGYVFSMYNMCFQCIIHVLNVFNLKCKLNGKLIPLNIHLCPYFHQLYIAMNLIQTRPGICSQRLLRVKSPGTY